ncbi:unnamed protein product [Discula destructiva]
MASQQQQQPEEALALQNALSSAQSASDFNTIADQLFASSLGIVHTRALFASFITALRNLDAPDLWIAVGTHTLSILDASPSASSSYLEQAATLRTLVADAHEKDADWRAAARILSEIPLESSQRRVSDDEKAQIWTRIMRLYLEDDDSTLAETFLNKLKNVIHTVTDPEIQLHFRLSAARINDAKRAFLSASQAYFELSVLPTIDEKERELMLENSIKCAILAPAGPPRSRMLGRLYKDERAAGLAQYRILEKMFLDRLIDPAEVEKFAAELAPHQLATTADGSTVLVRAMVEHNLLAASRLYVNIEFDALGLLLGLDAAKAEETTAKMIEQGRLGGKIDQIDQRIWFADEGEVDGFGGAIREWNSRVLGVAEDVEGVVDSMQQEIPAFVAQNLVV